MKGEEGISADIQVTKYNRGHVTRDNVKED